MNINVSFRHMDASPALRDYATAKLEKICDKYVHGNVSADITFKVEKHRHVANFTLSIRNLTVRGEEKTDDMYSSVDLALDKIEKQLRRHKDRIRDHKPSSAQSRKFKLGVLSAPSSEDSPAHDLDEDVEFLADYEAYPAPEESGEAAEETTIKTPTGVKLLKHGDFEAKRLTIEEAVMQLELLTDRAFFVFTEAESGAINVVYKRQDGHIGIIATD